MSSWGDIHKGSRYKIWRNAVLKNGNYKCCLCGATDNLTADHIKPVSTYPELVLHVKNGRVLCEPCRVRNMLESHRNGLFIKRWRYKNETDRG